MKTTAIATQKGGTGKTSTAISLAAGLAHKGKRVLLLDVDQQANSSKVLLENYMQIRSSESVYATIIEQQPLAIHPTRVPNLDIAPGHILLSNTDVALMTALDHREARLRTALEPVHDRYDYAFIDCPPSLGWLTINAMTAADDILVVIEPGYFELDSVVQITRTIQEVQKLFNKQVKLRGFLFNKHDPTTNSKECLKILRQSYPEHVLNAVIPRNVDMKNASFNKQDIFTYNPHSKAAFAFSKVLEEVFDE